MVVEAGAPRDDSEHCQGVFRTLFDCFSRLRIILHYVFKNTYLDVTIFDHLSSFLANAKEGSKVWKISLFFENETTFHDPHTHALRLASLSLVAPAAPPVPETNKNGGVAGTLLS